MKGYERQSLRNDSSKTMFKVADNVCICIYICIKFTDSYNVQAREQ